MGQKSWLDWQDEQAREYGVDAYEEIMMTENPDHKYPCSGKRANPTAQIVYS